MDTYKINIEGLEFELSSKDAQQLDLLKQGDELHTLSDGTSYKSKLLSINDKTVTLQVNHNLYTINIADEVDLMVEKMGLNKVAEVVMNEVKAPMPGLILDIMVTEGQEIAAGDPILILEAMKMENVIKAVGKGKVKSILLEKGTTVEKNQVIIEMDA